MSAYGDVLDFDADGYAVDSQGVRYQRISELEVTRID